MFEKVKSFLGRVNEAAGVELNFLTDNKIEVSVVVLKLSKKNIRISERKEFVLAELSDLSAHLQKNIPIAITLNGKNFLHRTLKAGGEDDLQKNASVAFPSINTEEFYLQQFRNEFTLILSLVRKEMLDKVIDSISSQSFHILSLSFGPFEINNYLSLVQGLKENVIVKNHNFAIKESQISDYTLLPQRSVGNNVKVGEEQIEEQFLIPYASAINHLAQVPSPVQLDVSKVFTLKEEWIQKQLFSILGWGLLAGFFVLLLINFSLFSTLNEKNAELLSILSYNKSNLDQFHNLEKKVKERKVFLQNAGWLNTTRSSFFADRIASTVPQEINLLDLNINPLDDKKTKIEKKPVIINNRIFVRGKCNDPSILNSWLGRIKDFKWVKDIKGQNYGFENSNRTGFFDFYIELTE